jgi:hypothetical protein
MRRCERDDSRNRGEASAEEGSGVVRTMGGRGGDARQGEAVFSLDLGRRYGRDEPESTCPIMGKKGCKTKRWIEMR